MSQKIMLFFLVIVIAASFRLTGVNWDQGQHLHPDERFLTMVTERLSWPSSWYQYFDSHTSPLNPHNREYNFYVYGTWPVIWTKWIAELVGMADYDGITLVGRSLTAMVDIFTTILVFVITSLIERKKGTLLPFIASFFYAISVLPIQLSHFYAVDPYLTCFLTLTFLFLCLMLKKPSRQYMYAVGVGISFGMAIATKISAIYFSPIILLAYLGSYINTSEKKPMIISSGICFLFCLCTVRLALPYLFDTPAFFSYTLNQKVIENWKQLESFNDPNGGFPPAVQWITTRSYLFPLKNILFWGLGLPLGILAIGSIIYLTIRISHRIVTRSFRYVDLQDTRYQILFLSLVWIFLLFGYQGRQFVKALRYFYPLYPFFALIAAVGYTHLSHRLQTSTFSPRGTYVILFFTLLLTLAYPVSFLSLYTQEHSRVSASRWIYANIPAGSTLSTEHWDDGLPLSLPEGLTYQQYKQVEFPLYFPDNEDKWNQMRKGLTQVDYIVMSSNRLYGSLTTVPEKFPLTYRYYHMLFDGSLGFEKVAEFTVRPRIPIPFLRWCITPPFVRYGIVALPTQECPHDGISFVDDYADETFTVYDHPKVTIFKKIRSIPYHEYLSP